MNNVQNAIDINQFNEAVNIDNYNSYNSSNLKFTKMYNITFNGITGRYQNYAGSFSCSSTVPCHDFVFENVDLKGLYSYSTNWSCSNIYGSVKNVFPPLTCLR